MKNPKQKNGPDRATSKPTKEELINACIDKTGFVLENDVTEAFESAGWNTIPNRYYVDDNSSAVREVDLVAYKAVELGEITHYTTLIISCKKSDRHAFAFLVRDKKRNDPNVDWHPIKIWSNSKSISYFLDKDLKQEWVNRLIDEGLYKNTLNVDSRLFASQEITIESGTANNDTNIFNSITTLMKAQAYEMGSLESGRKSNISTYSMHLITVVDCEMYTVSFKSGKREVRKTIDENFIYSYIINSKQTSSQIRFSHKSIINEVIKSYDLYHGRIADYIKEKDDQFYDRILKSDEPSRKNYLITEFSKRAKNLLAMARGIYSEEGAKDIEVLLSYEKEKDIVVILTNLEEAEIEAFTRRKWLKWNMDQLLNEIYRFKGEYKIVKFDDPPF